MRNTGLLRRLGAAGGLLLEDIDIQRAQEAVDSLSQSFPQRAIPDLQELRRMAAALEPGMPRDRLTRIYRVAHDLRGDGGSFGYELVTRIAGQAGVEHPFDLGPFGEPAGQGQRSQSAAPAMRA